MTCEVIDGPQRLSYSGSYPGTVPGLKDSLMSNVVNHSGLKAILLLDAATGVTVALLHFAVPHLLSQWLGLPVPLLLGSAVLLLCYVALLVGMARAPRIRRWVLLFLVGANVAWALACLALAVGLAGATWLGTAYLAMQAMTVFAFAAWQWQMGRSGHPSHPKAGWPSFGL